MTNEEPRQAHILAVTATAKIGSKAAAREAFEARVLYFLDQSLWPMTPPEGGMPDIAVGDGALFVTVSAEGAELVGSARVAAAPVALTCEQRDELRVYAQAQDPSAEIPAGTLGLKLSNLDVWAKAADAAPILARARVSPAEAAQREVVATDASVYAAALGAPEPAPILVPAAQIPARAGLLEFVRDHWSVVEFDRHLSLVGPEDIQASTDLPPDIGEALVCRDQESGRLVLVTVAEPGAGVNVVGETLRHIGWLHQHATADGQRVTGLIVAEEPTDDLIYAASAAPNVELAALGLRLSPLSQPPVDAAGAEARFWRTLEKLSGWCAVHSLEAALVSEARAFDPVAEDSPVWDYAATLARAVDYRCPWTAGHSARVADLLAQMADQLRLGGDVRQYLRMAGLLHDLGNVGVPSHLFDKRTRLSADEFTAFKRHPELGARIVHGIALLSPVAAGIRHHHERLDGHGYPAELAGEQIPLMARMVGVACCFDAMTSRRPYREAISPETALDIMHAEAGRHWDSRIVDALARIVTQ